MAIITAVLVEVAGSTYAVPLSAVREILKTNDAILKTVGTRRVILLRDEVLALVNLGDALREGEAHVAAAAGAGLPVVVVDFEGMKIGLEVEKIHGTREVVIKSLSRHYREVEGLIGASILGNGTIALIVDVETLIHLHSNNGLGRSVGRAAGIFDVAGHKETAGTAPAQAPSAEQPAANDRAPEAPAAPPASTPQPAPAEPQPPAAAPDPNPPQGQSIEELASLVTGSKGRLFEEVNNTGAIQASMSLSQFTGKEIRVSFPESRLVDLSQVAELMGGEEITVEGSTSASRGT